MTRRGHPPVVAKEVDPARCTVTHRLAALHHVPFFRDLSHIDLDEVNRRFRAASFETGETIYFSGAPADRLYVVTEGKVKLVRHTPSGHDVLLDILAPGEIFGGLPALGEAAYPETAQAQSPCCILGIDARHFEELLKSYPDVTLSVLAIVSERLRDAHDRISHHASTPVEARVATVLMKLAQKLGIESQGRILIETPLSRQDVAAMTGSTTESVSRVMSQFRRAGLIESGRGWTVLCAPDQLAELAETSVTN